MWTKKFKPIKVIKIIPNSNSYDEDKYTLEYMEKFGIDNVCGGSFCKFELSYENKKTIQQMLKGSTDKCYECGKVGHFSKDCELFTLREEVKRLNNELSTLKEKVSHLLGLLFIEPPSPLIALSTVPIADPPTPFLSKLNKTKGLELLKMWCHEMSKDNIKFYLLEKEHYYVIAKDPYSSLTKTYPYLGSFPFWGVNMNFDNFESALLKNGGYTLIYETSDYKIHILGHIKRNKRDK